MGKGLALLAAAVLLALAFGREEVRAAKPCVVPKDWGSLRAMALDKYGSPIFAFEASDGTVRTVPAGCKSPAGAIDTIERQ